MPRIDPVTGVTVMTMQEFWRSEADREGREPEELIDDFHAQLEQEREAEELHLRANALAIVNEHIDQANAWLDEDDEKLSPVVEVLQVQEVRAADGLGPSCERIVMAARRADGHVGTLEYEHRQWPGTRLDPPEDALKLLWDDEQGFES